MEELLEKNLQEVVRLYFSGHSVKQASEEVKKNGRELGSTNIRNN